MKKTSKPKQTAASGLSEEYRRLLHAYASGGGESILGQGYELGRRAISERKSLVEIAALHHEVVRELVGNEQSAERRGDLLAKSGEFLAECLSPYEMAQSGFQDAVKALRQLNETLEEEIKRIAYAVHDEAGQLLVAVHLALAEMVRESPKPVQEQIAHIEGLLNEVEKHLRRYSHELRPTILDDLGWLPAIRFLAEGVSKRSALAIHVETSLSGRLSNAMETTLYRIAQEALNNAVKHAKAKNVWIRAWKNKGTLFCSIHDDGVGFDMRQQQVTVQKGLGLGAMKERVNAIGGTLFVESNPGGGTEIRLQVSLEDYHDNSSVTR